MVGSRAYDFMYRFYAPWDAVGVRPGLIELVGSGRVTPDSHSRVIDLGCGTGANVVYLTQEGFDVVGVDFSPVALTKARERAAEAGVECDFIEGDVTAEIAGVIGPFDLVIDFGTMDDLAPETRPKMVAQIERLSRPGSLLLMFCFHARRDDLPRFSFTGPSRMVGAIDPDELGRLFSGGWAREDLMVDPDNALLLTLLQRQ